MEKMARLIRYYKETKEQEQCKINDELRHMKSHLLKSLKELKSRASSSACPPKVQLKPQSTRIGSSVLTYPTAVETVPHRQPLQMTAQKISNSHNKSSYQQVTESKRKVQKLASSHFQKENSYQMANSKVKNLRSSQNGNDTFLSPIKPLLNHNLENMGTLDLTEIEKETQEIENRINKLKSKSEMELQRRANPKGNQAQRDRLQDYEMMKQKYGAMLHQRSSDNNRL